MNNRKTKTSAASKLVLIFLLVALCLVLAGIGWVILNIPVQVEQTFGPASPELSSFQRYTYAVRLALHQNSLLMPQGGSLEDWEFMISEGDSIRTLALEIYQAGFIADADVFIDYLIYAGLDTKIQAGKHTVNPQMNALEIAQELIDSTPEDVIFGLLPGWRVEEIAALLPGSGLPFSETDFLFSVYNPPTALSLEFWNTPGSLEGLLAAGEYEMPRETNLEEFLKILIDSQRDVFTPEVVAALSNQGLSPYDGLILASIVEREAVVDEEKPLIASVFLNRLAIGMRLESDPTVQYAVGYNLEQATWWTNPISSAQLQLESPYNSYLYAGLPPTPICTPSLQAIQAVAFPAESPYYFFRAACDDSGKHLFAETYEVHLLNACP